MRKRNHTVTIRMNKAEYDLLQNKVKESGRTQQEVVIKAIADLKIASAEEVEELKRLNQMFADILCQLRGATTNINQIARKLHTDRILDSRRENFKISKAYQHKVEVVNVITAPEIEMLIICNEGKYQDFEKKKGMSPSEYCKSILKMKNVKSVSFVKEYFSDISVLEKSLHEYKRLSKVRKSEKTIYDLLRSEDNKKKMEG